MSIVRLLKLARATFAAALVGVGALAPAVAQDDPPGRVGRVAEVNGGVSWFDADEGQWTEVELNRPLTGADRISTAIDGRRLASARPGAVTAAKWKSAADDEKLVSSCTPASLPCACAARSGRESALTAEPPLPQSPALRIDPSRHHAGRACAARIGLPTLRGMSSGGQASIWCAKPLQDLRPAPSAYRDCFAAWV